MCAVLPTKGKGLAWRPACHKLKKALMLAEIDAADIAFDGLRPIRDGQDSARTVLSDRIATPFVPFDDASR
jgi:hypothetical protein